MSRPPAFTAAEAAAATGGRVEGDPACTAYGFAADSRTIEAGRAFVAIGHGHDFTAEALSRGAAFVVAERAEAVPDGHSAVLVGDTRDAIWTLGRLVRDRLQAKVIGITGSTGKTLTKDLTAAALRARYEVHSLGGSLNQEIGVPLVCGSCPATADVMVVEMGARHPGDVAALCELVSPAVGIVTGIGTAHIGVFGDRDTIARSKAELPAALPADGHAVLPSGDDFLSLLTAATAARVTTAGPGGHVRTSVLATSFEATTARITAGTDSVAVALPLAGRPLLRNAAFALAAAGACGVDLESAAGAMARAELSRWRMQVSSVGALTIVNDAYNANPTSAAAALRTVAELSAGRERWAVLGEMAELGDEAASAHARIGKLAAALNFQVVALGPWSHLLAGPGGFGAPGVDEAVELVLGRARPDAVVLLKGSRVAGLDRAAVALEERAGAA